MRKRLKTILNLPVRPIEMRFEAMLTVSNTEKLSGACSDFALI